MANYYDPILRKWRTKDVSPYDKGYYATPTALTTALPVGAAGWFCNVGTTDTVWIWDADTSAWVDTTFNLTKAKIEAALTGEISSHSHAGGGGSTVQTLGTSGTQTINRATSDKWQQTPSGATTLAVSDFADMQTAELKIINGSTHVSFPASWQWDATSLISAPSFMVDYSTVKYDPVFGSPIPVLNKYGYNLFELQSINQNSVDHIYIKHKRSFIDVTGYTPRMLLHMNGDNDGTTFVESAIGTSISTGNQYPKTKTATKVFGTASGYFNGSDSCLHVGDGAVGLGAGNFTIQGWLFPTSTAGRQGILYSASDAQWIGIELNLGMANNMAVYVTATGGAWDILQADTDNNTDSGIGHIPLNLNAWNHFALVRYGNYWMLFINGQIDWVRVRSGTIVEPVEVKKVGYAPGPRAYYQGYMDELCIIAGEALFTAPFELPKTSFLPA